MSGIFGSLSGATTNSRDQQKDPHEAEARAALKRLRQSFDELFRLRARNEAAMRGQDPKCRFTAEEMRQRVSIYRDPAMERRFQQEMWHLLRTLYRRDPTKLEIQAGPPSGEGMGALPLLLGVGAIVAGSAWATTRITNYLASIERDAYGEQDTATAAAGRTLSRLAKGAIAVTAVGGASYGAFRLWRWARSRKGRQEIEELTALEEPEALPAADEAEKEEES